MTKEEMLKILFELFDNCSLQVNSENMELYDESPDSAVDHDELMNRITSYLTGQKDTS